MVSYEGMYAIFWLESIWDWTLSLVCLYYLYRFWIFRCFPVINKRHYLLTMTLNCCCLLFVCVEKPAFMYYVIFLSEHETLHLVLMIAERMAFWIGVYGTVLLVVVRAWLLSYDIHLSLASNEHNWIYHINSTQMYLRKNTMEWYIRHKNTFGNDRFLLIYIVAPVIIGLAILSNVMQFVGQNSNLTRIIQNSTFAVFFSLCLYIWKYQLPAYYDYIYLRLEMRFIMIFGMLALIAYIVYTLTRYLQSPTHPVVSLFTLLAIFSPILTIFAASVCLSSTYMVLQWAGLNDFYKEYKNEYEKKGLKVSMVKAKYELWYKKLQQEQRGSYQSDVSHTNVNNTNSDRMGWKDWLKAIISTDWLMTYRYDIKKDLSLRAILSVMSRLQVFMDFLFHEFSQENLLAIIEFTQFQVYHMNAVGSDSQENLTNNQIHKKTVESIIFPIETEGNENVKSPQSESSLLTLDTLLSSARDLEKNEEKKINGFKLPEEMVKSDIVHDTNKNMNEKISTLIIKYLVSDSPFSLNVRYELRSYFDKLHKDPSSLQNMTFRDKCLIFEPVITEIASLMQDSLSRFKQTTMYDKLVENSAGIP